jgi:hypothetical protein
VFFSVLPLEVDQEHLLINIEVDLLDFSGRVNDEALMAISDLHPFAPLGLEFENCDCWAVSA